MTETLAPVKPGKLIINGEAVDAASGKTFTTFNPATEEPICDGGARRAPRTSTARCRRRAPRSRRAVVAR